MKVTNSSILNTYTSCIIINSHWMPHPVPECFRWFISSTHSQIEISSNIESVITFLIRKFKVFECMTSTWRQHVIRAYRYQILMLKDVLRISLHGIIPSGIVGISLNYCVPFLLQPHFIHTLLIPMKFQVINLTS